MARDYAGEYRNARQRVLDALFDGEWHSYNELERVGGVRYGARLLELRRLGWRIASVPRDDPNGGKDYRLVSRLGVGRGPKRRVRLYLDPDEAAVVAAAHSLRQTIRSKARRALARYIANEGKL